MFQNVFLSNLYVLVDLVCKLTKARVIRREEGVFFEKMSQGVAYQLVINGIN